MLAAFARLGGRQVSDYTAHSIYRCNMTQPLSATSLPQSRPPLLESIMLEKKFIVRCVVIVLDDGLGV